MSIDAATEQRLADARSRQRQNRETPLLIRDDGMLYPNTALMRKHPRYRPYHGHPKANLDERMRYLDGQGPKRDVTYEPPPPFDIGAADVDALINFAQEEYGMVLDPSKPVRTLREQVFKLSKGEPVPPPAARGLS
jgi:hypothetical protein